MGYDTAGTADVDSVVPDEWGGMWFLRDALDCEHVGVTLLELEPGGKGKRHDHDGTDHEEVYLVVAGELTVEVGDETVTLGNGEAVRVDPHTTRQVFNRGDAPLRVVVAGAP
ncbi:cupin domain-containing protein [Halorarius halobius]|uniref:cupin domain-containing protein n=1 Tax=Halorarius halobius TaxID=2962671 RepID=UPI0020CC9E12|nr:cupin domain-containing protein [Halorarius halobius]